MNCKNCNTGFDITQSDKEIYGQLAVPEPTLCPDCRNKRRMAYRNDRSFYRDKSDLSGKSMISLYAPGRPYKVYLSTEWYSDNWNPLDFGRDFDFSRPFFEQFEELQREVPRMNLDIVNCENSEFCNYCGDDRNCYLDIAGEANEDCYYNLFVKYSKDTVDSTFVYNSRLCYESINCYECHNVKYGQYCNNTSDSAFVYDLIGCKNCLFSYNLRNKEYYIFNKPHSKEEFEKKWNEILSGSYTLLQSAIEKWKEHLPVNAIFRDSYQVNCENCTGNNLKDCKNVQFGFNVTNAEDSKYLYDVLDAKDCVDLNYSLYKPELSVELISTLNMTHSAFSMASHYCHDIFYCDQTNHSKHLFACDGLTHKEYCILNKQYSKEEYEDLKSKIVEHMKKTGEWGQFFPANLSPFGYNETVAQEYFPLTKEQAQKSDFKWQDYKAPPPEATKSIPADRLPDSITEIPDDVTNWAIVDEVNGRPFKIIPQELRFYRNHFLPVPHRSPDQRHLDRMAKRTPRRLFDRKCGKCGANIKTTYAPERPEKIYCEACYHKEVY
ncbi:hypothetical protein KJ742_05075 [Patescibacteria group bacterium]|nr:hypothetical protein [Patescibacteria group bacterium]MBU1683291.1 hypothetical protein [Patescibacteria group bacterium]MBU1935307.1 hypothetical protein [Patescibacteria group bacterium]